VAEALSGILSRTPEDATRAVIAPIGDVEATTLHRLLGWNPHSRTRFRHHRGNRLPHDVILVDEASMVSLTHMARLLEAVRPTARLILVGDADQLVSVDAGAVLADLVAAAEDSSNPPIALARLRTVHRFGARIGRLAEALRRGDADMVVATLRSPDESATGASPSTDASSARSPGPDPDGSVQWIEEADPPGPASAPDRARTNCPRRCQCRGFRGAPWQPWVLTDCCAPTGKAHMACAGGTS
jgi:exodeoxyribonuclease V alpha subunit